MGSTTPAAMVATGQRRATPSGSFRFLAEALEGLATAASAAGAPAYVEADFFGGVGTQAAAGS
jgi:hypothetical protein